jgi:hypothetical protein
MNFDKVQISNFIDSHLPKFISEDYTKFSSFFQEYYQSLEIPGGPLNISNNMLEYFDLENLTKQDLISGTTLVSGITSSDTTIQVSSVAGFAQKNGIVIIDDEIIFYQDLDVINNKFLNCARGYSAVTNYKSTGTTVDSSVAVSHNSNAPVNNLSNLFSFAILKHYQNQYLQGFPYTEILSNIDKITLIKNIKEFYQLKGTSLSVEFLFRVIFNEEITLRYPREYVIKPSYSNWSVDDIIKVEAISGNPLNISGQEIYQSDEIGTASISSLPEPVIANDVVSYSSGDKLIYEIRLNILNNINFVVPKQSFLRKNLISTDIVITVDSTIGFPETNGIIKIGNELIFYKLKSFSQFYQCTRGYLNTTATSHNNFSNVSTTEYLYSYINGDKLNPVKMKLVGLVSSIKINDGGSYYTEADQVSVLSDGTTDDRYQFATGLQSGWKINEEGFTADSGIASYKLQIKNILSEVTGLYKDDEYVYVASTGFPKNSIGDFVGITSSIPAGDQFHFKRIPLTPDVATQIQPVGRKAVGMFLDGVEAYGVKDTTSEIYGYITSVTVINSGYGFLDGVKPLIRVTGGGGTGAVLSPNTINGSVTSISVISGGTGYTSSPTLEIAYGFDGVAGIISDNDISNGTIQKITVISGGTNYIVAPEVQIIDTSGRGKGAYAVATISGGSVTKIDVLTGGLDYNNRSAIVINLLSRGREVQTLANIKEWIYDRGFVLKNIFNITTNKWEPSAAKKTDVNNGYLFRGLDDTLGLEYAYPFNPKALRFSVQTSNGTPDNVGGFVSGYAEVTSNFVHSPILGWSYDGHPIYGPYGYANPLTVGNVKRITPSYQLKSSPSLNRPSIVNYPLGAFIDDYEFVSSIGDLDVHNGRYCVTPEFPNGTYAYFITVDAGGEGIFPYIIGPSYNSNPVTVNFLNEYRQRDSYLPENVVRIRTANTPNEGYDVTVKISSVKRGSINEYLIGDSLAYYKAGDFVYIDNTNTEGSNAYATVESITGQSVSSISYAIASGATFASGITLGSGYLPVYPDLITLPAGSTVKYETVITTISGHQLITGDSVFVNVDINPNLSQKTFKVRVSTIQTISYQPPTLTVSGTTLQSSLSYNQNTISVVSVVGFSDLDFISINGEICQITSGGINNSTNQIDIVRGVDQKLHSSGDPVVLYIPDNNFDYRFTLGGSITDGVATGVVSKLDKINKQIEIRIAGNSYFTANSVIYDNSTPVPNPLIPSSYDGRKRLLISSITQKQIYWEIDPTNTGLFYIRDLTFNFTKGNRYIFDVSDSSNSGYYLSFSQDTDNNISIYNITRTGVAGTPNAKIIFNETNLTTLNVSRVYYYELNGKVSNNNPYFVVKPHPFSGLHTITSIDSNRFKYSISQQPDSTNFNQISYFTYSTNTIGAINSIKNIDGGKNYKKLPKILGISHIDADSAKFIASTSLGKITSVFVSKQGFRYSPNTILKVISSYGTGAILEPNIYNGQIISVKVISGGTGYSSSDISIVAIDCSNTIIPTSNTIGQIKTLEIFQSGNQVNLNRTLSKQVDAGYNLLVFTNSNSFYNSGEILTASNGAIIRVVSSYQVSNNSYFVKANLLFGIIEENTNLVGNIFGITSTIKQVKYAKLFTQATGYLGRFGYFASDLGKLDSYSQRITDSYYYQDFSYAIRSNLSKKDYSQLVHKSTHPLGFKLFGEVAIEANFKAPMSSSIYQIIKTGITPSTIQVPDTINTTPSGKKITVSILNTRILSTIPGKGSGLNDTQNLELDVRQFDDISTSFDGGSFRYTLTSSSEQVKALTGLESIVSINQIIQEPLDISTISTITASGNVLTVNTPTNHNLSQTISGITYPYNQYITLSGISVLKLNDTYEIFDSPSPTSFRVLFNNKTNLNGTVSSSGAVLIKGNHIINNNVLSFIETPKDGSDFYGIQYKFNDSINTSRYCYKIKELLFNGVQTAFDIIRKDTGAIVNTDDDENLFIFLDGIFQNYGESYIIDRDSTSPTYKKIIFTTAPKKEQLFFGYSFSKYKIFDDISSQFNSATTNFTLSLNTTPFKVSVSNQLFVLLDDVPQKYGESYTINNSVINFKEAPTGGKKCKLIYLYGKTFDKKFYIYNQDLYSNLTITDYTVDGCPIYSIAQDAYPYISPGDKLVLQGETPKEVISIQNTATENLGKKEYVLLIYNDDNYVYGKDAIATATLTGITLSGGLVTSGIGKIDINFPGLGYDAAPIILFKSTCNNPGRGATAVTDVKDGKVVSITVTSPGSGYTKVPSVIFTKPFNIIKNQYPVYAYKDLTVKIGSFGSTASTLNIIDITTKFKNIYELLLNSLTFTSKFERIIDINCGLVDDATYSGDKISKDATALKLGVKLLNLDKNKFTYYPKALGSDLDRFEGYAGLNIGQISAYMPNLTIADVTNRPGSEKGSNFNDPSFNLGIASYTTFGTVLASGITASGTTITLSSVTGLLGFHNYFTYSEQLEQSGSWILTNSSVATNLYTPTPNNQPYSQVLIANSVNSQHGAYQDFLYAQSGVTYTFSVYSQYTSDIYLRMTLSGATGPRTQTWFNVYNGKPGNNVGNRYSISKEPNNWYRCSITKTAVSDGLLRCGLFVQSADNQMIWSGDNIQGLFLFGSQLERTPYPGRYQVSSDTPANPINFPIFIGKELIRYTSISGTTLLNCTRGPNAYPHIFGEYARVAWEE